MFRRGRLCDRDIVGMIPVRTPSCRRHLSNSPLLMLVTFGDDVSYKPKVQVLVRLAAGGGWRLCRDDGYEVHTKYNIIATQSSQPPSRATPLATNILINIVVHLVVITHPQ